jgi:phosphoribosylaminoimidazole carboxylase PurE protein
MSVHDSDGVRVAILFGSESDREVMEEAGRVLERFDVKHELRALSAHRTPDTVREFARGARSRGVEVLICGAGMAAHLAGAVAAGTTLPVLGVPLSGGALDGLDALLATVQMPAGVPVGTLAIGKAGARNAAVLAVQILALADADLARKLDEMKEALAKGQRL